MTATYKLMERPRDWVIQIIQGYISFVVPPLTGAAALVLIALGLGYLLRDTGISENAANALLVGWVIVIPMLARLAGRRLGLADNGPLRQTHLSGDHAAMVRQFEWWFRGGADSASPSGFHCC
jgi:hypothetical protein